MLRRLVEFCLLVGSQTIGHVGFGSLTGEIMMRPCTRLCRHMRPYEFCALGPMLFQAHEDCLQPSLHRHTVKAPSRPPNKRLKL